jgi:cyclopropane-fatty-acyl-phospholipid synthase
MQPMVDWTPQTEVRPRRLLFPNPWHTLVLSLAARIEIGQLSIALPDGFTRSFSGQRDSHRRASLIVRNERAFRRLILGGDLAFAEAYLDGDWETPDLPGFLELAMRNEALLGRMIGGTSLARRLYRFGHLLRANTRHGSRRNIAQHYDIGNEFYRLWLDPGMTYSSGLFTSGSETLGEAQEAKYRSIAEMLALSRGQALLEIGCGWGGFALIAARDYGCRVTAVTLSAEQAAFARERVAREGLSDRVEIRLGDYRDIRGTFDRIASIEMFEAVGERYWPTFFMMIDRCLTSGGIAALQTITIDDRRFASYRRNADFIQRYIFPGGMLPSPGALRRQIGRAGFRAVQERAFGSSYAQTLSLWTDAFQRNCRELQRLGFDERFRRTWLYYLAYFEAGFRLGSIDVMQIRIEREAAVN